MYDLFKFLHVATAIMWIGSGVGFLVLTARLATVDRSGLLAVMAQSDALGKRLFAPSAMGTLVFGIITVLLSDGNYSFEEPWIVIGFAGFVVSLVMSFVRTPAGKKMGIALRENGPDHADVAAGINTIRILGIADVIILFVVVGAMVFKPGAA